MNKCYLCPRKCGVDREQNLGFCKSPNEFRLARAALHFWEEPCISGKNGSGAVFFSGCNLGCVYCQNGEISKENKGIAVSNGKLLEIFDKLISQGAENINLVTPTHYSHRLAELLKANPLPVPVVYNCSGYEGAEALKELEGAVDIYLADFKYISPDRAKRYSNAPDYPDTVKTALREMRRQIVQDEFDDEGMMKKGLIIRHLVLPANTNQSLKIIDYLSENYKDSYISIMAQYVPCGNLENYPEINRQITQREYDKVVNHAIQKGLNKVFIQELSNNEKNFIPKFDFTGIV